MGNFVSNGLSAVLFAVVAQHSCHYRGRTRWKLHVKCDSHCIMSKKMGMVALRSSISGTSVISSMGPTISGMNLILWAPEEKTKTHYWIHLKLWCAAISSAKKLCFCQSFLLKSLIKELHREDYSYGIQGHKIKLINIGWSIFSCSAVVIECKGTWQPGNSSGKVGKQHVWQVPTAMVRWLRL